MQQILKRLELIKMSITLEDKEIIELQVMKIKGLEFDDDVSSILASLDNLDFSSALVAIDLYLSKKTGLVSYEDKELQGLRFELKMLEQQIQQLSECQNDYATEIEDFNTEYNLKLGEIIQQVLVLREKILHHQFQAKQQAFNTSNAEYDDAKKEVNEIKRKINEYEEALEELNEFSDEYEKLQEELENLQHELLEKQRKLNKKRKCVKEEKDKLDDDNVSKDYQEAQEDSAQFKKEYLSVLAEDNFELDAEEMAALKLAYRKASKLCHPDLVSDKLKEQAHTIMSELNAARKKKDLKAVEAILLSLQTGVGFNIASDTIKNKDLLKAKIIEAKNTLITLKDGINNLEQSEEYHNIKKIEDKDSYFNELNEQLQSELNRLEIAYKALVQAESIDMKDTVSNETT